MATTACRPRLYLWEDRTLFIGPLKEILDISTGASTLLIGLEKTIIFKTNAMHSPIACRCALIPAGTTITIDTQNAAIANCTLDPLGEDFYKLSSLMLNRVDNIFYNIKNENIYINALSHIGHNPKNTERIRKLLTQLLIIQPSQKGLPPHEIDPRIKKIIILIQQTANLNLTLSELANQANLSPSRLTELFKKQTGLPLRRYRLWYRLYLTGIKIGQKKSITEAAFEAGFNDSPHFNRTFRSMLGVTPSYVLSQSLQIILPNKVRDKLKTYSSKPTLTN